RRRLERIEQIERAFAVPAPDEALAGLEYRCELLRDARRLLANAVAAARARADDAETRRRQRSHSRRERARQKLAEKPRRDRNRAYAVRCAHAIRNASVGGLPARDEVLRQIA